jgi:hypothetical protein
MERELFDWEQWDGDLECMTFYKVILKQPMGIFKPGMSFDSASLSWDTGILHLFYNKTLAGEFKLQLTLA